VAGANARRIGDYSPRASRRTAPNALTELRGCVSLRTSVASASNVYVRHEAGERRVLAGVGDRELLLEFFPDATMRLVYNPDVFDQGLHGLTRREDQTRKKTKTARCQQKKRTPFLHLCSTP